MRSTTVQKITALQKNPQSIRNICILAHVDHGKTTLADTLVASNGIISQRMAGKLRYMDSREDEQIRGITMKSSAISLLYNKDDTDYLINLIDSPGHIDFSSEVSTAVRLCDGAIVVVDVVEGVCPQTHAVLRQAWLENIKPILVLNKLDRLITEWKMSPLEAHLHLQQILEQVNAITGELFTSEILEKASAQIDNQENNTSAESSNEQIYDWSSGLEDTDDSHIYFSPDQGNVVFASALDGWGFGINQFAEMYSSKLGIKVDILRKTLWGDFYLNMKQKKIMKGAQAKAKKPLFVQFVLENIWSVYEAIGIRKDKDMMEKIVKSLNLKIQTRDARHNDPKVQLQAVFSQWLPLSNAVLAVVCEKLPSPLDIVPDRVEKLMCSQARRFDSLPQQTQQLKEDFISCSSGDEKPVIVFVSKMFPIDRKSLPENRQRPLTTEEIAERRERAKKRHAEKMAAAATNGEISDTGAIKLEEISEDTSHSAIAIPEPKKEEEECDQIFIAFARVFSGTVKKGQKLYVLGPKHDPSRALDDSVPVASDLTVEELSSSQHITTFEADNLYLFMGRELEELDEVPAGNVLGIGGLEHHVLKSATLSSTVACPAFTAMFFEATPIVKVAIEPSHPGDMGKLAQGLKLLNQADPCVEVLVQETGEHVVIAAGEVHLQRCVDDLRERYAKVELNVSAPIVPFRETIIPPPKVDMVNEVIQDQNQILKKSEEKDEDEDQVIAPGLVELHTTNQLCSLRIRALPLPNAVTDLLESNPDLIKTLDRYSVVRVAEKHDVQGVSKLTSDTISHIKDFKHSLKAAFEEAGNQWKSAIEDIWSFGPRRVGPNILLNRVPEYDRPSIWTCLERKTLEEAEAETKARLRDFDNGIVSGFQLATLQGPLCEEQMRGVCFIIEKWDTKNDHKVAPNTSHTEKSIQNLSIADRRDSECEADETDKCEAEKQGAAAVKRHVGAAPLSGQLMSCVKDGCRKAFQSQPQRLMVAMYKCVIQATSDVLGKMYAVIGKRNGRILDEDMKEGTQLFNITAAVPVVESFGFAEEFRKKTSGLASPQLKFSHWELLDVDPFWVPTTEEEYLHFGEKADSQNQARIYMNSVRRRKGLKVDEKIVEHAEKQRTLTKNK